MRGNSQMACAFKTLEDSQMEKEYFDDQRLTDFLWKGKKREMKDTSNITLENMEIQE